jgi:hypothetical protein
VSLKTVSLLVHGSSKTGKSTLSSTAPTPLLVLDAEGGWKFIREAGFRSGVPLRKITWDPLTAPPPRADGTWEVCVVSVQQWQTLTQTYAWLTQAPHDFASVVVDSVTEAQRRLKSNLRGTEQMKIQDWGDLLTHMDRFIRDTRDLVLLPNTSLRVVVFIAETRQENGKWRPYMQGQISVSLPYWVDVVGYLYPEQELGPDGQSTEKVLKLLVAQHPQYEAGERVQGVLGDIVRAPHIGQMLTTIFGETDSPGDAREETKV